MGKVIQFATDTLRALVGGLGNPERDKAAGLYYANPVWDDAQLINAYRGAWLPRKIVDIPAMDSCRAWRNWQAEADQIEKIEEEEARLNVRGKVLEARTKARLFGGAAIFIGTGDARPEDEFKPELVKVGGVRYLNVMTRRQLSAGEIETDPQSPFYNRPRWYEMTSQTAGVVRIHPSRLVIFTGAARPDDDLAGSIDQGWGDSVLVSTLTAIQQADATAANVASLVFESKIDIVRIPQMMASLADPAYREQLLERFSLAAAAKGNNGTLILDKEEEYDQKSASFATLPELMDRFFQQVSGAADIPMTRLFGQSPGGLNASGESDLRNYYDRISAMQQLEMSPAMEVLDESLIRSALGARPPEVHYVWASLWQIGQKEKADIGKINAETIKTLNDTALFPPEALASAGANMLVENSILPGLEQAIEEAGGLPDYVMEAEEEKERERLRLEATKQGGQQPEQLQTGDAAPRTLYIRRDVINVDEIRAWAKGQGFDTVQDGLHVTVIHTRTPIDWIKVGSDGEWSDSGGQIEIAPGGPRLMERFGDAVVLQFASSRLTWRHEDIKRLGAQTDYPEYQPHVTISWAASAVDLTQVEPYKGRIVLGPEIFEEVNESWREKVTEA